MLGMMEYRANLIVHLANSLAFHLVTLGALWGMFSRFQSMGGWTYREVAFLYTVFLFAHALFTLFGAAVLRVPELVRTGQFDQFMIRPLPQLFQVVTLPVRSAFNNLVLAGLMSLVIWPGVGVDWNLTRVLALIGGIFGGFLVDFGFHLIIASTSFWMVRVTTLNDLISSFTLEFARYPATIFSRSVQTLLIVLPVSFVAYYSTRLVLGRVDSGILPLEAGFFAPLVGLVWMGLCLGLWSAGLRRYQSTGS